LAKPPAELLRVSELSNWLAPSVERSGGASSTVVKLGDALVGNAQDLAGVAERQPQFINQDTDRVTRQSSCLFLFSGCLTEEALGSAHLLDHGRRRREVLDLDSDFGGIHIEPRSHEVSGHALDVADASGLSDEIELRHADDPPTWLPLDKSPVGLVALLWCHRSNQSPPRHRSRSVFGVSFTTSV
jgi:hypothetical protein